jgi:PAS domain S-box-containing protein
MTGTRVAGREEFTVVRTSDEELQQLVHEEGFRAVFESSNDIMLILNKKGQIIDVNRESIGISGFTKNEVIGKHIKVFSNILTPKSMAKAISNLLKRMAGTGVPSYEIDIINRDGEPMTFKISARPLRKENQIIGDLVTMRDVTELKQVEHETSQKSSDINLINLINEAANQGKSFEEVFRLVSAETQKLFGANVAIVYLLSKDKQYLEMQNLNLPPKMTHGIENLIHADIKGVKIRLKDEGIYTGILKTGKAVLTNDLMVMEKMAKECTEDKHLQKLVFPIIKGLGIFSAISVPLKNDSEAFGLLDIARKELFTESDMKRIEIIAGQLVNIIKRKQAEEALKASEQNFRNSMDSSLMGIHIVDENNYTLYLNQAYLDIFGYTNIEEVRRSPPFTHYTPESYADFILRRETRLRGELIPDHVENDIVHKDGSIRHLQLFRKEVLWNGKKQYQLLCNDITALKNSELQIKKQKALTDRILESTPNAVAVVGQDQRIIMVNKAFYHTFDLAKGKAEGKEIGEIIQVPFFLDTISQVLTSSKSRFQIEFKLKKNTLERILVADVISMQKNEVLAILNDITEEREMQEKLAQTDRLASLGEMAAGIAHELNNPLTGVVAMSELLLESETLGDIKKDLESISSEGQRAANVVKNLLSFARSHTLSAQPVKINDVVNQVLDLRAYEHRVNNIAVVTHLDPDIPEIIADRFQLQQVFVNIVLNAEQAMIESHERGNLTVTSEVIKGMIRTSFSDDGPGIPQDIINRIFDPFFTTKDAGKGTGLGLSISYGIVSKLGGRIYAESKPGKGASFVVELPLKHK